MARQTAGSIRNGSLEMVRLEHYGCHGDGVLPGCLIRCTVRPICRYLISINYDDDLAARSRAHSDPTESDRRSSFLLGRIFFDEPVSTSLENACVG